MKDKVYMTFLEKLDNELTIAECRLFGLKNGCRKDCPVYESEQCPNQRGNEVFFNWLENKDKF